MDWKEKALDYHSRGRHGKVETVPTKPCHTQEDLSLAYTPGVAEPCLEIAVDPLKSYRYTSRANLVAVVSDGSAVLGLGNIGGLAGKPVMEGKGVLFKHFADVDVFDIELNTQEPEKIVEIVASLEPTFGGINLEDIAAPKCFYIEEELIKRMEVPVFHDDQHGTAIISAAAFLNAIELQNKNIEEMRVVFSGAGAAAVACATLYMHLGVKRENMVMCDRSGVIYQGRTENMNPYKERFAVKSKLRTLADAMRGADAFCGVSSAGLVTKEMVKSMAPRPIVFAMANPVPEISYVEAREARDDIIMATGRSDFPNQVNNVLGFPFIFRGALDVRARQINMEMKVAATRALAQQAKQEVPERVLDAYGLKRLEFGPEYIIPKPFDPNVLFAVAPAVAEAATKTGVARKRLESLDAYVKELEKRARHIERLQVPE